MLRGAGPAPPPSAAGGGHVPAEHDPRGQRGSPAAAPERRARAPCATYARRANVRRLRGEERADKTCLFHHFHPKSIMPSSPIDLREHRDHGRADPGAARLPRAAAPTILDKHVLPGVWVTTLAFMYGTLRARRRLPRVLQHQSSSVLTTGAEGTTGRALRAPALQWHSSRRGSQFSSAMSKEWQQPC